jgi:hypothetical protein
MCRSPRRRRRQQNRCIERDRPPVQMYQLLGQVCNLVGIGLLYRLCDLVDTVGHSRGAGGKHVQQCCDPGQQKNRRQRHLDDMRHQIER